MTEPTPAVPLSGDADADRITLSEVFTTPQPTAPAPDPLTAPLSGVEVRRPLPPTPNEAPPAPKKKVTLDLDALDAEEPPQRKEPFTFRLGGVEYQPEDPEELDWQELLVGQENPRLMMHVILPEEQRTAFFGQKLAVRKLKRLTEDYAKHYGLGEQGEGAGSARS